MSFGDFKPYIINIEWPANNKDGWGNKKLHGRYSTLTECDAEFERVTSLKTCARYSKDVNPVELKAQIRSTGVKDGD